MSVTKSSYPSTHSLSPRHIRIEKDSTTAIIIIDDVITGGVVEVHTEIDRPTAWLKIVQGFELTILNGEPSGITPFSPLHGEWGKTRLYAQSSEVFVVKYTSTAKTTQEEVTGYAMGSSSDVVYVKIDREADRVTIYQ